MIIDDLIDINQSTTQPRKAVHLMRDRLIELMRQAEFAYLDFSKMHSCEKSLTDFTTDYLLSNGVIVPPCKVGDVVYAKKGCFYLPHATRIKADDIITCEIIAIKETKKGKFLLLKPLLEEAFNMRSANDWFSFLAIGKTVFLTKEEAEQALKGGVE